MRRTLLTILTLVAVAVAGCGGGSHAAKQKPLGAQQVPAAKLPSHCPKGSSAMGCSILLPNPSNRLRAGRVPSGPLFPDVYEGQGAVNWSSVKAWQASHGWKAAAIFKMGEFRVDSEALRNAAQTKALGFWRAGYWFVRNTGCPSEAAQITSAAKTLSVPVVVLDIEVPEAHGYGACLSPLLRARGFIVVEYTSPGSNPGGVDASDPLWIATFGPSFGCIWTCKPVAWQFTDGVFFAPVSIPGIGTDDVNVDLGITKLGAQAKPAVDPYAKYPDVVIKFGADHARERTTVLTWDRSKCRNPVRRPVCKTTRAHLVLLLGRIDFIAGHKLSRGHWVTLKAPRWGSDKLGSRAAGIRSRL